MSIGQIPTSTCGWMAMPAKDGTKHIGLGRRITYSDGHAIHLNDKSDDEYNNQ